MAVLHSDQLLVKLSSSFQMFKVSKFFVVCSDCGNLIPLDMVILSEVGPI